MVNHVPLIVLPESKETMTRAIVEAHRRYTRGVNFRQGWQGHLWQALFASFPLYERSLLTATRYIELNPLRAGLVDRPENYPWSSAQAHMASRDDVLVTVAALVDMVSEWGEFLSGGERFLSQIENTLGRILRGQKPGRKPRQRPK